jgi:hypothetical protein
MLRISDLYIIVDLPENFRFVRLTIFLIKSTIFVKVNLLEVNIFFLVVERPSIVP